jgi:TPR repeat protein
MANPNPPSFSLICGSKPFVRTKRWLTNNFALFSDNTRLFESSEYVVKSAVSSEVFTEFLQWVQGESVAITKDNYQSLSLLSEEFGVPTLKADRDAFMASEHDPESQSDSIAAPISVIDERLQGQESGRLLTSTEVKDLSDRLLSVEKGLSNLQVLFDTEQHYRRGQELLYGEHGFEKSLSLGLEHLKAAADQHHSDSCYLYGKHLSEGLICERNYEESAKYEEESASQGNSFGEVGFGLCLREGKGVAKDADRGLEYL